MGRKKKQQGNPKLAIGYVRVSKRDQELSPEAQRQQIMRWAEKRGIVVVEIHTDKGVSGSRPLDKRPGLMHAISDLKESGSGVLIVAKRDRLARDVLVAAMVERLVEKTGAQIQSADGAGNGKSPEQLLLRGMIDLLAQYERAMIRARTKAAADEKRRRGERWGQIPYGKKLGPDGKTLIDDPREQQAIEVIRKQRAEGECLRRICLYLDLAKLPPRTAKTWSVPTLHNICQRLGIERGPRHGFVPVKDLDAIES